MKILYIVSTLFWLNTHAFSQQPFLLSLEQPEIDVISDVTQIEDRFYFIQNRITNLVLGNPASDYDSYSDIFITDETGNILEQYNLNGYRTQYQRILKVDGNDLYLVGYLKTDTCQSRLVISKYNILTHQLNHIMFYDFCMNIMMKIKIVKALYGQTYIEEYHSSGPSIVKQILNIDSNYTITPIFDDMSFSESLSVDFSRKGYLIASSDLYNFYDENFIYRKQKLLNEDAFYINESREPFGNSLILVETIQPRSDLPNPGAQIMLIDSNMNIKHKVSFIPLNDFHGSMNLPFFEGISIKNENEIWATGHFHINPPDYDTSFYFIAKLDSNLNIICQHFLGNDTKYRIYGIRSLQSGGAIIFGSRLREGLSINEGEDVFALRVGENCELPTTVSANGPAETLVSISAYPNPGINDLTFSINGFDPSSLRVELVDGSGKTLFTKTDISNSIQIPQLPAGQYFYRILKAERLLGVGSWVKE
ncbi:MAG: T9SS type A sorting domain-containing protein [Saprospiraceae bacterium]